jgi:2'-5' RNA ligase
VDHVIIPLDEVHAALVDDLADRLAVAAGVRRTVAGRPHVTLVAYSGAGRSEARDAVAAATANTEPFVLRAHGFGVFAGDAYGDLNVHVPVVRNDALAALHRDVLDAIRSVGAVTAGWTEVDAWTPHVTLLDRNLDPTHLGAGVGWLATHHHPSWQVPVDRVDVTGGWTEQTTTCDPILLGH